MVKKRGVRDWQVPLAWLEEAVRAGVKVGYVFRHVHDYVLTVPRP